MVGNALDGDGNGTGGDAYQREFSIALPPGLTYEGSNNDTLYTATALPLTEDPPGSGLFIGRGLGRQDPAGSTWSDADYWRFEALAGDVVSVSVDTPKSGIDTYVQLHNAADNYVTYDYSSGPDGDAFISHYTIPTSGTYYVKVGNQSNFAGEYELHVELARGIQQETDGGYGNDSLSGANVLTMTTAGTHRTATITGTIMGPENSNTDEDYFNLGVLNTGNTVELNFRQPSDSTLIPRVTLRDSSGAAVSDLDGNSNDGHVLAAIAADGTYYAEVESRIWAHNGHEYRLTGSGESWTAAEAEAVALGGHLVTVNDAAEQQWLTSTFGPLANLWIGYTDQGSENAWYWSSGEAATYTNWASGRPYANTTSYNHAYMGSNGQWNDYVNSYSPQGIIELPWAGGEAGPGSYAQYLLDVDTADLVPPRITSVTGLPKAGATMGETVQSFSLTLSEAMAPATVNAGSRMVWENGGHFYTLTQTSGSWTAAETEAQALGGHLVTVNDGTEQEWLRQNFERFGSLWIGLTDQAVEGTWKWIGDGTIPVYTNWASGEPNSGNDYDWAYMESGNQWRDGHGTYSYRGIIELTDTDTDADGLPASVDPYPSDPLNAWDLREVGSDNIFDSTDDIIYRLTLTPAYTGGTGVSLFINNGPLPSGHYRFSANSKLTDVVGNALDGDGNGAGGDAYQREFSIALPSGLTYEGSNNDTLYTATALPLTEDPPGSGLFIGRGLGRQDPAGSTYTDPDYWRFEALAGDVVSVSVDTPKSGIDTYVQLHNAADNYVTYDYSSGPDGDAFISHYTIPTSGTYYVKVGNQSNVPGDYELHVELARGVQQETDGSYSNDSISGANVVTMTTAGTHRTGTIAGTIMAPGDANVDEDFFNIGAAQAGETIFLSLRLPESSTLDPVIEVRNSIGALVSIAKNPSSAVARIDVTSPDAYYATVLAKRGLGGPHGQYLLDAAIWPTGELNVADLGVTAITAPATAASGEMVHFTWTVGNFGTSAPDATSWYDQIVLSTNDRYGDADDIPIAAVGHTGTLAPGEQYTTGVDARLPLGRSGSYWVFVNTDHSHNVFEYIFEENNIGISESQLSVALTPFADLAATAVSSPSIGVAGQPTTVTWTVTNLSDGITGDGTPGGTIDHWVDRIVLSTNSTFGDADDRLIADVAHTGSLTAGGSYDGSFAGLLPSGISGSYSLFVYTDVTDTVYEQGNVHSNLGQSAGSITVAPAVFADLTISNVTSPASALVGQSISVQWIGTNTDKAWTATPVSQWYDRVILSRDNTYGNGDDRTLGQFVHSGAVNRGQSYSGGGTVTIPADISGDFSLFVVADANNNVFEFSYEGNNASASQPLTVTGPDLVVDSVAVPATGQFGQEIDVSWTIRNIGNAAAEAVWHERIWLSRDEVLSADDTLLLTQSANAAPLSAGSEYNRTVSAKLPVGASFSEGPYFILLQTDALSTQPEINEANNTRASDAVNVIYGEHPDLMVQDLTVTPASPKSGDQMTLNWTDVNIGNSASGGYSDFVGVKNTTTNQWLVYTSFAVGSVDAGGIQARTYSFKLPDGDAGAGTWVITITNDWGNNVFEYNAGGTAETNNSAGLTFNSAEKLYANLAVSNFTAPATGRGGQSATIGWTVTNEGTVDTGDQWTDRIILSSDLVIGDADDIRLADVAHAGSLAPGASYTQSMEVVLPLHLNGTYYLAVQADTFQQVLEPDTRADNTTAPAAMAITAPHADLRVEIVDAPAEAQGGQQVTAAWRVRNSGDSATEAGQWKDYVYLSSDTAFDNNDRYLAEITRNGALSVDGAYTLTANVFIPYDIAGNYYFLIKTDAENVVYEAGFENNNVGSALAATNIRPAPVADLQVVSVSVPDGGVPGERRTVSWTVQNLGEARAQGSWADRVYLTASGSLSGAVQVATVTKAHDLAPGGEPGNSYQESMEIALPDVTDGVYRLLVITDALNQIYEVPNESNNQLVTDAGLAITHPDLYAEALSLADSAVSGSTVDFEWKVRNTGSASVTGAWTDNVYLSRNAVVDGSDLLLHSRNINRTLGLNDFYSETGSFKLPIGAEGDYFVLLFTDAGNQIKELNAEGNNTAAAPLKVNLAPYADFVVSEVTAPDLSIGDPVEITVSWTVTNQGNGAGITDTWTDAVVASRDGIAGNADDIVLKRFVHQGALNVGENYHREETFLLPPRFEGRFTLFVRSDVDGQVFENGFEANNTASAENFFDVMKIPYADLVIDSVTPEAQALSGLPLDVTSELLMSPVVVFPRRVWKR